jgi:polyphosphate kinase 2 (PPK2 family)
MKFTKQKEVFEAYFNHDKKIVIKFLWLPVTTRDQETRWLERATVVYKADKHRGKYYWEPWEFIG